MKPDIRILQLVEGAKEASGITVIIDVCRAFTVGAYAFGSGAEEVLSGGFVNAAAIANYIISKDPAEVSLVGMGYEAKTPCVEDTLCAECLRDMVLGRPVDFNELRKQIFESDTGARFHDPAKPWFPESDLHLCTELNRFDFVLRCCTEDDSLMRFRRIDL